MLIGVSWHFKIHSKSCQQNHKIIIKHQQITPVQSILLANYIIQYFTFYLYSKI